MAFVGLLIALGLAMIIVGAVRIVRPPTPPGRHNQDKLTVKNFFSAATTDTYEAKPHELATELTKGTWDNPTCKGASLSSPTCPGP